MYKNFIVYLSLLLFCSNQSYFAQTMLPQEAWIDSVYYSMSTDQKIGQVFMARAFSKSDLAEVEKVKRYIDSLHIGGLCFFQGNPVKQAELTNIYQEKSKIPLFIGIDGEWGLGMRFPESVMKFPKQLTLGAIADDALVYKMGAQIAKHCKRMGIHFNFAPVIDINNNAANPVINDRSFGEDKFYVTTKAIAYMKGLQDNGIMATAKHFPGHGDTNVDSHYDLPILNHTVKHLHNIELFPFKALINEGVRSIMVGHLQIPQLDDRPKRSATVSYKIVTELLKQELGYDGLIITDAMEMKGVAKNFTRGLAEVEAFLAGCDLILMPDDLPTAIALFKSYVNSGAISPSRLEESVRKVLKAKYQSQTYNRSKINTYDVVNFLNNNESVGVKTELIEASLTLVKDYHNVIPFTQDPSLKLMSIGVGIPAKNTFHNRLSDYHNFNHFVIKKEIPQAERTKLLEQASKHDYTILSLHDMSRSADKGYGITKASIGFINDLSKRTKLILVVFGNPYSLKYFDEVPSIIMAYEDDDLFHDVTAQHIFGVSAFNGRLPITASPSYGLADGITKNTLGTLGYSVPERVGMDSKKMEEIDNLALELIKKRAAPGCAVLVAKDNKIIYQKSFGNHTYAFVQPVKNDHVFDVASLTKILSGTLSVMKLYEDKKVSVDGNLGRYIPELSGSNKNDLILSDVLAHHGRLIPFINFYENTISVQKVSKQKKKVVTLSPKVYNSFSSESFNVPVAQKIFMKSSYVDTIWRKIYDSPLRESDNYRYSDLGFYMVKKVVENMSGQKLDKYVDKNFYSSLGLKKTMYNPIGKIPLSEILPTEYDSYFRNQTVHGTVHDMGAAMLGGVSGHAGLFSNTKETATILQMLLNGGSYRGKKYLSESTIDLFTKRHYKSSRRGLGFDLKETDGRSTMNMSELAPIETYGHTGFTGTCAYVDPINKIVFVFLSNRTFPDMDNNLLHKNDYRPKIQDVIYRAMRN